MGGGFGESTSRPPESPSCSGTGGSSGVGNFECNICYDLAQDPIVTLCGHLYCWPCLYKWLHVHAHSPECPVCKAVIQEDKLVPLYGRGKTATDPRSKCVDIPNRPAGQRPETAPPLDRNHFPHHGFGFMGGFSPVATARLGNWGNFTFSAGFGGLFPSLFNFHLHGFPDATTYGADDGYPYGFLNSFHGGHAHWFHQRTLGHQMESNPALLFIIIGLLVTIYLLL